MDSSLIPKQVVQPVFRVVRHVTIWTIVMFVMILVDGSKIMLICAPNVKILTAKFVLMIKHATNVN